MVTSLQLPMISSFPRPSSSAPALNRQRFSKTACAKFPFPPVNPKDPFLLKLASVAAKSPETLFNRPSDSDTPPFLDVFGSPQLMATPAQVERSVSYNEHRPRRPPPDLPSILLNGRIVYIGMPLVPAVTELVLAELMYLQYMDDKEPIYLYINSTGTTRDDGEPVGLETEGYAIYDYLAQMRNEIHTVGIGCAMGQACLLLAAGTKGKRYMFPHTKAMIQQPRLPPSGIMQASDVAIRTREAVISRDTFVKLFARHTGNSIETIRKAIRLPFHMDAVKAKKFGVIDKILWRGQEKIMAELVPPEEWDKNAGIEV